MDEIVEHRIEIPEQTEEIREEYPSSSEPSRTPLMSQIPRTSFSPRRHSISMFNHHSFHHNNQHQHRRSIVVRVFRYIGYKNWTFILYGFCLLVVIFFFLLWWFSSTGNLPIKDGRILHISSSVEPFSLNNTAFELKRLSVMEAAASPNPNIFLNVQ